MQRGWDSNRMIEASITNGSSLSLLLGIRIGIYSEFFLIAFYTNKRFV
jgi:hypothetical protein